MAQNYHTQRSMGSNAPSKRRVAVFIDYQNCYGAARETFFQKNDPPPLGGIAPMALAHAMASQGGGDYDLVHVGVYCGIAERRKDLRTYLARQKQIKAWEIAGAKVFARPLRYPPNWTPAFQEKPEEKGVDVKLSIDAVMGAIQGVYDVAILASADSDLVPVADALLELQRAHGAPRVEAIAWKGQGFQKKLGLGGKAQVTYCWIADYGPIGDSIDYNL